MAEVNPLDTKKDEKKNILKKLSDAANEITRFFQGKKIFLCLIRLLKIDGWLIITIVKHGELTKHIALLIMDPSP